MSTARGGLLAVQVKRSESVKLTKAIGEYAKRVYADRGDGIVNESLNDLEEVDQLRNEVISTSNPIDKQLELLMKYYHALSAMELRFPISKNKDHISNLTFVWWDAFKASKKEKQANINFEKAAVLFNMGALYSQQGIDADRTTPEGLKLACKKFQDAAGVFAYLKESIALRTDSPHPLDISPDAAKVLESLMLAQAQECVFEKAVNEKKSEGVCARLGKQCYLFYHEVVSLIQDSPLSNHLDKTWVTHLKCKESLFDGECQVLMADAEMKKDETDVGTKIARLRYADLKLKSCVKMAKGASAFFLEGANKLSQTVSVSLEKAVKENETVYLCKVPDHDTLTPIAEAAMVKSLQPADLKKVSGDLFTGLVPDSSAKTVSKYTEMVDTLIKAEKDKLGSATDEARIKLKELELPELLLALEKGDTRVMKTILPDSLKSKIDDLNTRSGIEHCFELTKELQDLRNVGTEMLNSAEQDLQMESQEDQSQREIYKDRWTIPMSASLTMLLKDSIDDFRAKLTTAEASDQKVVQQLQQPNNSLSILDTKRMNEGIPVLQIPIMSVGPDPNVVVGKLRSTLVQLENCASERTLLEEKLNDTKFKDNILPKLMSTRDSEEKLFKEEMEKYKPLQDSVAKNLKAQEELLKSLISYHSEFVSVYNVSEWKSSCAAYASQIKSSYESYNQLQQDLEKGLGFYTSLQDAIGALKQQCSDFCITRKMQRDDFIGQLQRQQQLLQQQNMNAAYATQSMPPQSMPPQSMQQQQYQQPHLSSTPPPPTFYPPPPNPQYNVGHVNTQMQQMNFSNQNQSAPQPNAQYYQQNVYPGVNYQQQQPRSPNPQGYNYPPQNPQYSQQQPMYQYSQENFAQGQAYPRNDIESQGSQSNPLQR